MNLLQQQQQKERFFIKSWCLAFSGKFGTSATPRLYSFLAPFSSSWIAEACCRPEVGMGSWEGHRTSRVSLRWDWVSGVLNHWDHAIVFQDPFPPLYSCLVPVGTWVFDPCSCQTAFLVGSALVLCSCCFFAMSFPFTLACPNLSLIFKARSKAHSDVESLMAVMVLSPVFLHRTAWCTAFDFTQFIVLPLLPPRR